MVKNKFIFENDNASAKEIIYRFGKKEISNVAFFDLDHTLIKPKSGRKFPKDGDDYIFLYSNIIEKLNKLIENNYMICIITNQNGLLKEKNKEKYDQMIYKLNKVFENIEDKSMISIFMACGENYYRKPHSGLYYFYESMCNINIDKKKSFFCGDALGRSGDFSDSDYNFGYNCGISVYTPEEIFDTLSESLRISGKKEYIYVPKRPYIESMISNESKVKFMELVDNIKGINEQKIIVLCGSPSSGKSSFSQYMCEKCNFECCESDILKTRLEKCVENKLKSGINVIVDATNATKVHREKYINMVNKFNKNIINICVYIPYNEDMIHHLQHYRIEKSKGSIKALPEIALRVYKSKYEKPVKSEGFDYLYEYIPYITFSSKSDKDDFLKYY
jgi:bifunctional polynucleotide phosphatase/kinase